MRSRDARPLEDRLRTALNIELTELREGVDMSAAAISHRLMELAEMSQLCLALAPRQPKPARESPA